MARTYKSGKPVSVRPRTGVILFDNDPEDSFSVESDYSAGSYNSQRLDGGLMAGFFRKLLDVFKRKKLDFDELEEALIAGDLGLKMTMQILAVLRGMGRELQAEDVVDVARAEIAKILPKAPLPLARFEDRPAVVLVVGVAKSSAILPSQTHRTFEYGARRVSDVR